MNGSMTSIGKLIDEMLPLNLARTDVVLFPPIPYVATVVERVRNTGVSVGVQNIHSERAGAFTGEVAAEMVKELGATHVLVGHSERRRLFGESDAFIAQKCAAAIRGGLVPIVCVGETLSERADGRAEAVVAAQLSAIVDGVGIDVFRFAMIAYEPVWAIGTGRTATPTDAQLMHAAIRARIRRVDATIAEGLRILYGGSVNAENASEMFAEADVDGGLVGGASLSARQFLDICKAA